jgi:hypothetical protein
VARPPLSFDEGVIKSMRPDVVDAIIAEKDDTRLLSEVNHAV